MKIKKIKAIYNSEGRGDISLEAAVVKSCSDISRSYPRHHSLYLKQKAQSSFWRHTSLCPASRLSVWGSTKRPCCPPPSMYVSEFGCLLPSMWISRLKEVAWVQLKLQHSSLLWLVCTSRGTHRKGVCACNPLIL